MARQALITYDGSGLHPSGPHVLSAKSAEGVGRALEAFRVRYTDAPQATSIRIDIKNRGEPGASFIEAAHARCVREFGVPTADYGQRAPGMSNWFLDQSHLMPALQLIDSMTPAPTDELGYGLLRMSYEVQFRLIDSTTRRAFPFQGPEDYLNAEADYDRYLGRSRLTAVVSARTSVSVFLSFPFEDWNEQLASYVLSMQEVLPFRISEKRWKRWHLNKGGTGYVGRKLAVSLR